jgi:hypothetical protein
MERNKNDAADGEAICEAVRRPTMRDRARPVGATPGRRGPSCTRHLICERHRYDLERAPRRELRDPGVLLRFLLGASQDGMRSDDETPSQISVALLGVRPELLLAAGRILSRYQAAKSRPD